MLTFVTVKNKSKATYQYKYRVLTLVKSIIGLRFLHRRVRVSILRQERQTQSSLMYKQ